MLMSSGGMEVPDTAPHRLCRDLVCPKMMLERRLLAKRHDLAENDVQPSRESGTLVMNPDDPFTLAQDEISRTFRPIAVCRR